MSTRRLSVNDLPDLREVEDVIRRYEPEGLARVSPGDVVTAEWVRMKCQFGCGGYGQCLTCPPHSPTPRQTRRMLDEYETAYLVWWGSGHHERTALGELEREVFLLGYWRAFLLAGGPCSLCRPCPLEHPCRHPRAARPAMEACGIDVYETAHRAGFPLKVVTRREDTPNFYGLLLVH
jgi:predicted metal-binding protein